MYKIRAPFKFAFGLVTALLYGTAIIFQNACKNEDDKYKTWQ